MSQCVRLPIIGGSGELGDQIVGTVGGHRIHATKTLPRSNIHINARWPHEHHSPTASNTTISKGEAILTPRRKGGILLHVRPYHHSVYS